MVDIIYALSTVANVKSALELTVSVARYVLRKTRTEDANELKPGFLSYADKRQALELTYKEWEHVALTLEPAIKAQLRSYSTRDLSERAELLAKLAKAHAEREHYSRLDNLEQIHLRHSAFTITPEGKFELRLGLSDQTKSLSGESLDFPHASLPTHRKSLNPTGGNMPLPKFKVTMLGASGAGKTVFMSSMYTRMRENNYDIAIRAVSNDVDLELGGYMENIFEYNNWPPGTDVNEKTYEFELLLRGQPIARIDWVDYRGGALTEAEDSPGGKVLIERLRDSHSVIWMIDMSRLQKDSLASMKARLATKVGRMANLCRNATAERCHLRSILFVRTKSDEVKNGGGVPDWDLAGEELLLHLGSARRFDNIPFSAAIPVSSVGRLDASKNVHGDDPQNVEWPLILSLAFMMEADLEKLELAAVDAQFTYKQQLPGQTMQLFKEVFRLGPSDAEVQAYRAFSDISRQVMGMREVITSLLQHTPKSIKFFDR